MATNVHELFDLHREAGNPVADRRLVLLAVLADALSLYLKTRNFYRDLSDPHFRDYRLMLDEQASGILDAIDRLAERVGADGSATFRSLGQAARLRITADNAADDVVPGAMLAELIEDNEALADAMREAHELCGELGDVATARLLEGSIDAAEKRAWLLREAAQPHRSQLAATGRTI